MTLKELADSLLKGPRGKALAAAMAAGNNKISVTVFLKDED